MTVHNIRTMEEYRETLSKEKVVIIDFFATWCGPCKAIAPLVVEHSNEDQYKDVFFAKIDVDELPDVSEEVGIRAMPTLMIFKDGEKVEEVVGPNPNSLGQFIAKAL